MIRFTLGLLIAGCLAFFAATTILHADTPHISAPDAAAGLASGELVVLDIRSKEEWAETGVAEGAWPVSMHASDFPQRLNAILASVPADQIALICATGGRTDYVTGILAKNGITGVADLSEGMFGNGTDPGWVARGMTVVPVEEAQSTYSEGLSLWTNK